MAKVLLTGSNGSIGSVLKTGLAALGHDVVGLDLAHGDEGGGADLTVDCTDPVAVEVAVAEVLPDAVIHLAGIPTESSLPDALSSHVISTGALLEAMQRHGVPRFVYASSNHAVGRTPRTVLLGADVDARPDTYYGVGKVAAEALLHLYVDRYGMDAVSTRIGTFAPKPTTRRQLSTWLSYEDAVRMFDAALTTPSPGFAVIYGVSDNTRGWWDLAPGRALGYDPVDDAETYAAEIESEPETDADHAEAEHVGGPFATAEFERPAFD
jgi:uronate dehydrogenase